MIQSNIFLILVISLLLIIALIIIISCIYSRKERFKSNDYTVPCPSSTKRVTIGGITKCGYYKCPSSCDNCVENTSGGPISCSLAPPCKTNQTQIEQNCVPSPTTCGNDYDCLGSRDCSSNTCICSDGNPIERLKDCGNAINFGGTTKYSLRGCSNGIRYAALAMNGALFNWTAVGNGFPISPFQSKNPNDYAVIPYFFQEKNNNKQTKGKIQRKDIEYTDANNNPVLYIGNKDSSVSGYTFGTDGGGMIDEGQSVSKEVNDSNSWSRWTPVFVDTCSSSSPPSCACGPSSQSENEYYFSIKDKFYLKHSYEDMYLGENGTVFYGAQFSLIWGSDDPSNRITFWFDNLHDQ